MAAKRRSRRITRPVKKRPAKKRVSSAAAKARAPRKSAVAVTGMVEDRAGGLCARGPHAAHRHSGDQQSARDLRTRRARAALGRHHQGGRGTSGEPCDPVRRCGAQRRSRARGAAGFLRSAHARPQCRRFAGRPRGGQGPAVVGRHFRKAAGVCDRRSGSSARRAGEPDRQCREVHRTGQRRAAGDGRCAARKARIAVAFAVSDSGIGLTLERDQAPVPAVLAGQCLHRLALRRRRARAVVGQATGARHGRRHRRDASAVAAAPPLPSMS